MMSLLDHVTRLPDCQLVYLHVLATNTQAIGQFGGRGEGPIYVLFGQCGGGSEGEEPTYVLFGQCGGGSEGEEPTYVLFGQCGGGSEGEGPT